MHDHKNHTDVGKTKVPKELQKFAGPPRAFDRQAWTADSICLGLAGYLFENQFGHCGSAETGIVFAFFALAKAQQDKSTHTHTQIQQCPQVWLDGACPHHSAWRGFSWICRWFSPLRHGQVITVFYEVHGKFMLFFCVKNELILKDWLGHLGFNKLF